MPLSWNEIRSRALAFSREWDSKKSERAEAQSFWNASFDARMREALLDCCALDWSAISPAIFGALFQSIMNDAARRNLGAHYTQRRKHPQAGDPLHSSIQHVAAAISL